MRLLFGTGAQQIPYSGALFSIWGDEPPGSIDEDILAKVLGTKWRSTSDGEVYSIRWYRPEGLPGAYSVALWEGTTNLTGEVVYSESTEGEFGWIKTDFSIPITVTANTIYIASALFPADAGYHSSEGIFSSSVTNSPLEAVSNSISANGVYADSATMVVPTTSAAEKCFFIDVVFSEVEILG